MHNYAVSIIKHSSTVFFLFLNILQNKGGWVINKLDVKKNSNTFIVLKFDHFLIYLYRTFNIYICCC